MLTEKLRFPALVIVFGLTVLAAIFWPRSRALNAQDDIVQHFKYGSIGTEGTVGIPYPLWRVLPVVFADKLPSRPGEGYERIGFIYEPNSPQSRPIGTTYQEDRVPLVGLNCATCHTGRCARRPRALARSSLACRRIRWTSRATRIS